MKNFRYGAGKGGYKKDERSFSKRKEGGFSNRSERKPLELHDAICAKCGKRTQVPFRPSGAKPVYCRDCFTDSAPSRPAPMRRESPRSESSGISAEQYEKLNAKLDKIMQALGIQ